MASRPFVTYDSTLLDHVSVGAATSAARTSIRLASMLFLTALTAAAAQMSVHDSARRTAGRAKPLKPIRLQGFALCEGEDSNLHGG